MTELRRWVFRSLLHLHGSNCVVNFENVKWINGYYIFEINIQLEQVHDIKNNSICVFPILILRAPDTH